MNRQTTFYLALVILGLGLFFEAIKGVDRSTNHKAKEVITAKDLRDLNLKPFHHEVHENKEAVRARLAKLRAAGHSAFPEQHSFGDSKPAAKKKLNLKKKKPKKKQAKKKKTKEKKDEETALVSDRPFYPEDQDANTPNSQANSYWGGAATPAVSAYAKPAEPENKNSKSYEEWERLLLTRADFKATMDLVNAFNTGDVDSETFYRLVMAMLTDTRSDLRQMALRALDATPTYQSFVILAEIAEKHEDPEFRQKAMGYLSSYSSISHLGALKMVLKFSESAYAVQLAALRLRESAEKYLNVQHSEGNQSQGQNGETPSRETASSKHARDFESFRSLLRQVMSQSNDPQTTEIISDTLQSIEGLLPG